MRTVESILDLIGNTPLLRLRGENIFAKAEFLNPGGSIKDRVAVAMLEGARRDGRLTDDSIIIEPTSGNTGIGLALVAAQKGYHLVLVLPDKMSQEKIFNLRAMGAEVVLTRSDVGRGHPEYYQDLGRKIADERGAYFINQFGNPDNPLAHEMTTAPEIVEQMGGELDAIVLGVGSSGTVSGIGKYLEEHAPPDAGGGDRRRRCRYA